MIKKGEFKVAFCLMMAILSDFITKTLQGGHCVNAQEILNLLASTSSNIHRSVLEDGKQMRELEK